MEGSLKGEVRGGRLSIATERGDKKQLQEVLGRGPLPTQQVLALI